MDIIEKLEKTCYILRGRGCGIHGGWVQEAIKEIECLRSELALLRGSSMLPQKAEEEEVEQGIDISGAVPNPEQPITVWDGYLPHSGIEPEEPTPEDYNHAIEPEDDQST